jgi:hypothetical protein
MYKHNTNPSMFALFALNSFFAFFAAFAVKSSPGSKPNYPRRKSESKPNRIEPPLLINCLQRHKNEPKADQKRIKTGSNVEKFLQAPAKSLSQNRKSRICANRSEPTARCLHFPLSACTPLA